MLQYLQASNTQAKVFKVLSIDGGGIKGLYSARILEQFEQKFDCRIADYFDLKGDVSAPTGIDQQSAGYGTET